MARTTVVVNSILPRQEAFLVDAPTPEASPHRWIQAYCSVWSAKSTVGPGSCALDIPEMGGEVTKDAT